jgi:hypothetical protein
MLLNGEMTDSFFSRVVLGKKDTGTGAKKPVLYVTLAASLICALFASYVIYYTYILNIPVVPFLDTKAIERKVAEYKLDLLTGGDPYLKDGYTRIVIVDESQTDIPQPVVVDSDYQPPVDKDARPDLYAKPVELTEEPEKRKRDKRVLVTPVYSGNFAIQFFDVDTVEAEKVRTLAKNNDFNLTTIGSTKKSSVRWNVYKEDDRSSILIAGRKVSFLKGFEKKSDAVKYLQDKRIAGVVASRTTYYDYFDLEVCCLGEEAANKLANGSGVSVNKVKIIKK